MYYESITYVLVFYNKKHKKVLFFVTYYVKLYK